MGRNLRGFMDGCHQAFAVVPFDFRHVNIRPLSDLLNESFSMHIAGRITGLCESAADAVQA